VVKQVLDEELVFLQNNPPPTFNPFLLTKTLLTIMGGPRTLSLDSN
jgi:hypothetical protein